MPRSAGQASPLTDTVHFTDIWHLAGQPAFRHFKQHDRLRLVDFQEDGLVNIDADQDQSRIVGRAMARIAFVRKPHLPVRRIQLNHFLDRATWLLLAPKVRFWELAGTISGQSIVSNVSATGRLPLKRVAEPPLNLPRVASCRARERGPSVEAHAVLRLAARAEAGNSHGWSD